MLPLAYSHLPREGHLVYTLICLPEAQFILILLGPDQVFSLHSFLFLFSFLVHQITLIVPDHFHDFFFFFFCTRYDQRWAERTAGCSLSLQLHGLRWSCGHLCLFWQTSPCIICRGKPAFVCASVYFSVHLSVCLPDSHFVSCLLLCLSWNCDTSVKSISLHLVCQEMVSLPYYSFSLSELSNVACTLVVVVVAFSSRARIWGECSTVHSLPALFSLKWKLACAH